MKKIEKAKTFVKEHKTAFIVAGVTVGTIVAGCIISKNMAGKLTIPDITPKPTSGRYPWEPSELSDAACDACRKMDEDIFVNVAPAIEKAVLDNETSMFRFDRFYDPYASGVSGKLVTIIIEDQKY